MILGRCKQQNRALVLRDLAAFHGAIVHSIVVVGRLGRAALAAAGARGGAEAARTPTPPEAWAPEETPLAGLFREARVTVARHTVLRAARVRDAEQALGLVARARRVAPWDDVIADCHVEARFRAGRVDDALVEELEDRTKDAKELSACAEYFRAASRLGKRRHVELACKRLSAAAEGSPHAWMARARMAFARVHEIGTVEKVEALLAGGPPAELDPRERVVFALYGAAPGDAVRDIRRDLTLHQGALEQGALQELQRAEDAAKEAEGRRRPAVPAEAGEWAAEQAIRALGARLEKPWTRAHALYPALSAHAVLAGWLEGRSGARIDDWLSALGDAAGLVPILDLAIRGDGAGKELLPDALARADAALDGVIQASWLKEHLEQLGTVWPDLRSLGGAADDLRRRAQEIQAAAALVEGRGGREQADRTLSDLLADVAARRAASRDEDCASGRAAAEDDGFRPMAVHPLALERSRGELATAEWAIARGLVEVFRFNAFRGHRDLKMLRGTREDTGSLWELRVKDGRLPIRLLYVLTGGGPVMLAIFAKQDEAHQRRIIRLVQGWPEAGSSN